MRNITLVDIALKCSKTQVIRKNMKGCTQEKSHMFARPAINVSDEGICWRNMN